MPYIYVSKETTEDGSVFPVVDMIQREGDERSFISIPRWRASKWKEAFEEYREEEEFQIARISWPDFEKLEHRFQMHLWLLSLSMGEVKELHQSEPVVAGIDCLALRMNQAGNLELGEPEHFWDEFRTPKEFLNELLHNEEKLERVGATTKFHHGDISKEEENISRRT